jgi:hypothetical protein
MPDEVKQAQAEHEKAVAEARNAETQAPASTTDTAKS